MVCLGKYPRGKSRQWGPAKAVWYVHSYLQSGVLCTPGLAVLRICIYGSQGVYTGQSQYHHHCGQGACTQLAICGKHHLFWPVSFVVMLGFCLCCKLHLVLKLSIFIQPALFMSCPGMSS